MVNEGVEHFRSYMWESNAAMAKQRAENEAARQSVKKGIERGELGIDKDGRVYRTERCNGVSYRVREGESKQASGLTLTGPGEGLVKTVREILAKRNQKQRRQEARQEAGPSNLELLRRNYG